MKKPSSKTTTTQTTEQGHLVSLTLDTPVSCPECGHTFELREGLGNATIAQLEARRAEFLTAKEEEIQARIEEEKKAAAEKTARELEKRFGAEKRKVVEDLEAANAELAELNKERSSLAKERSRLASERSKLELEVSRKLDEAQKQARKEREALEKSYEAKVRAAAENSRRLGLEEAKAEQSEALSQLSAQLEATRKQASRHATLLQQAELAKLEMEAKLQSQTHTMQVALKKETNKLRKELESEYEKANKSLLSDALEEERSKAALKLKAAEVEKAQLLGKVEKLHQQLEQKSQQVQGEALESLLEERLTELFPEDGIEGIKTGAQGEDVLHSVYDEAGNHVDNLSWEFKNRKQWSNKWLPKLAKDARDSGSSAAVLITTTLPADMEGKVAYIDGCWVCSVDAWEGLALLLRAQALEMARLRTGLEQSEEKASKVYQYLQSEKFRSAATSMLNTLADMEAQVDREERAFSKQWKARREQIRTLMGLHTDHTQTIETITAQQILDDDFLAGEEEEA
jgi:hypothetical protein